jgi:RNA exonuclease 4
MVGVGLKGIENALARVSIVDYHGDVLLDRFVKPIEHIVDYRSEITGIHPGDLDDGKISKQKHERGNDM